MTANWTISSTFDCGGNPDHEQERQMKIGVNVDPKAALVAGGNECGRKVIEVDPAAWTEEERRILAAYSDSSSDYTRHYPGADLVVGLSGLVAPTVEELRRVVGIKVTEKRATDAEREQRLNWEREESERNRLEWLAADPTGDKWLRVDHKRQDRRNGWVVRFCNWTDPEIDAVRVLAQAEADRRNAELDAQQDAEAAKEAERKREQERRKTEATAKLEKWVRASGSELTRLRLDNGYDCWVSAALSDYADAVAGTVAAGLEPAGDMKGYDVEGDERKCPTLVELQVLTAATKRAEAYKAEDGTTATVELLRVTYTPTEAEEDEEDETVKQTELRVTVLVCGYWECDRDYVIGE